ncbi:hypothetical protein FKP32DRAFT_861806 [Trametes sanguinea]|nr:hypothetical protein FKP32DRAFT_861806 [Trametes sanguinea]
MATSMLLGRTACIHTSCRIGPDGCASFIIIANGITRITPLAADEHCSACSHPWFSHTLDHMDSGHPNTAYQRGGLLESDCGGFASSVSPADWTFQTTCACGRALRSHQLVSLTGRDSGTSAALPHARSAHVDSDRQTHPFGAPSVGSGPLARPSLPLVAHAPPIMAYQGVRAAEPGRTIDRRNASAERARAAQAQVRGGRSTRNIPHMRVQTRARIDDAVSSAASSTIEDSKVEFCVVFIPHMPPNIPGGRQGYPARQFQWPAAAFAKLTDVLHQVGLVFIATLSGSGPVWRELGRHRQHDSIHSHARSIPTTISTSTRSLARICARSHSVRSPSH